MATYVPGTQEKDQSKVIMSLQQLGPGLDSATANIAANTANIATLQTTVAGLPTTAVTSVATSGLATGGPITATGTVTVTAAVQSDQETSTSNTVAVTPGVQQFHPSAAKAWVRFNGSATIQASYNVASVSRASAGQFTVTFTTSFSSANYACAVSVDSTGGTALFGFYNTPATGSIKVTTLNNSFAVADPTTCTVVCFGDQ